MRFGDSVVGIVSSVNFKFVRKIFFKTFVFAGIDASFIRPESIDVTMLTSLSCQEAFSLIVDWFIIC